MRLIQNIVMIIAIILAVLIMVMSFVYSVTDTPSENIIPLVFTTFGLAFIWATLKLFDKK